MPISQTYDPIQPPTESFKILSNINDLLEQLRYVSQRKISGRVTLKIQSPQIQQWSLYFSLGRLIWATDQMHPIRRWYRQVAQYGPTLTVEPASQVGNLPQPWHETVLARLVKQGKIRRREGEAIVAGHLAEILFDIFQQWTHIQNGPTPPMTYRCNPLSKVEPSLAAIPVDRVWLQATREWQAWRLAGLANYSPNQAPLLWQVASLRQKLSPMAYQSLAALVDGRRTLRDLAVKSRQDLLLMTQSIIPHVHQGSIRLVRVGDLQSPLRAVAMPPLQKVPRSLPRIPVRSASGSLSISSVSISSVSSVQPASGSRPISDSSALSISSASPRSTHPLVAHIDDHPLHVKMMGHILAHLNYRFMHLQDPVQALMGLLENKPSLIFLDLAMPIINGYELCAQIRQVSTFKNTPIIIVSSNDGIVDRIQAKNVGASDFLAKPIRLKNVQTILQRHISQSGAYE